MFLNPHQVVQYIPIEPRQRIADFGAGEGLYTLELIKKMRGEGSVFAFDVLDTFIESMHRKRLYQKIDNIFSLAVDLNRHIPLKDALLDASVIANTLHALNERERFLLELNRVTKSGGHVLMVDWMASFNHMGPPEKNVITPSEAVRLFRAHGFEPKKMLPAGTHHYAFIAKKA